MNKFKRSYDNRNILRLLELSLESSRPYEMYENIMMLLRRSYGPPNEDRISYEVENDHRPVCEHTNGLRTLVSYGLLLKKILRNGLKIVRTAFLVVRNVICDPGFNLK